jgi:hypothetical protein
LSYTFSSDINYVYHLIPKANVIIIVQPRFCENQLKLSFLPKELM